MSPRLAADHSRVWLDGSGQPAALEANGSVSRAPESPGCRPFVAQDAYTPRTGPPLT
jgi:hypothetical protein